MNDFNDFMTFRTMITPTLIMIAFASLSSLSIVGSIGTVAMLTLGGLAAGTGGSVIAAMVTDLVVLIFGCLFVPLYLRILCESLIVLFRMNDSLTEIARKH